MPSSPRSATCRSLRPERRTRRSVAGRTVALGQFGEPRDRAPQDPRDLHLRAADPLGDLALRHVAREAQEEDLALALRQRADQHADDRLMLREVEAVVLDPD